MERERREDGADKRQSVRTRYVCMCGVRPGIIVCNVSRLIIFPEQVMRAAQCLHRAHFTVHQLKNEEL